MKDKSTIAGEALMAKLAELADREIGGGVAPRTVVRSLITVAGNVGGGDTRLTCAVEPPLIYNFCKLFRENGTTNHSAKADLRIIYLRGRFTP